MKIPSRLKVGSLYYDVLYDDIERENGASGATYSDKLEIRISPDLPKERQDEIFMHELLHACCDFVKIEGKLTEEQFVSRIAPILCTVLKENKL